MNSPNATLDDVADRALPPQRTAMIQERAPHFVRCGSAGSLFWGP